ERVFADMDAWGYTFRLGSARAYLERDADAAWAWLQARGLVDARRGLAAAPAWGRHHAAPAGPHLQSPGTRSSLRAPLLRTPGFAVLRRNTLIVLAIGASLALSACKREPMPAEAAAPGTPAAAPEGETADAFIARVNAELKAMYPELTAAQWLSSTYITDDSQLLAAKANEKFLGSLNAWIEQSRKFEGQQMSPDTARAITLLKL